MDYEWNSYTENTKNEPTRHLTVKAMRFVRAKGRALDLGPGALNESRFLLEQGFKVVVAVNKHPLESDATVRERAASFPPGRFEYRVSMFDAFDFEPAAYDFINAQFSLPFSPPETFERMFTSLKSSLKPDGIVAAQFFGSRHEWNGTPGMTFVDRIRARELLSDLTLECFGEIEGPFRSAHGGIKYGHTFSFIARKK